MKGQQIEPLTGKVIAVLPLVSLIDKSIGGSIFDFKHNKTQRVGDIFDLLTPKCGAVVLSTNLLTLKTRCKHF